MKRERTYRVMMVLVAVFGALAGVELTARLAEHVGPASFRFRQFDPELGVSLIPGREGVHRRCYDGYVYINSHGMRDRERAREKKTGIFRIAIFGDSVMEAVHVKPEETATDILEKKINQQAREQSFEVLNFSVGGYATYQEYLHYVRDAVQFEPDLVLVVFNSNDLEGNLEDTSRAIGNLYSSPHLREVGDTYVGVKPEAPALVDFLGWSIDKSSALFFLYKAYYKLLQPRWGVELQPWIDANNPQYRYLDSQDPIAIQAWRTTEYILDRFVKRARDEGSEFGLVHMGYNVGSDPWYKPITNINRLPESFDASFATKWFQKLAQKKGIRTYDLGADIVAYVESNDLEEPYLSFTCDRHFNPEGQKVIADALYRALAEWGLVTPRGQQTSASM